MDSPKVVFNIEPAGASEVHAMNRHELHREPDGVSAIDPLRSHLNEVLHGPSGPSAALASIWAAGVQRPNKQAEKPYLRIVIGASPSYFRDPGQGPGEWNAERLADFQAKALEWLRAQFGSDLAFASLHLDEDTPHLHALVVPTYERKPRKPGRRKRGESADEFEARKAAALSAVGVRTAGRSSHPVLSRQGSFDTLRRSLADSLAPLGISYGDPGLPDKPSKTTRQWVKEEAARLGAERTALEAEREALTADRAALEVDQERLTADRAALEVDQERLTADRAALEKERVDLAAERVQVRGLLHRLGGLVKRVEAALEEVLRMGPRVRRLLQDAEAAAEDRRAAQDVRSEIVGVVPTFRAATSFLSGARRGDHEDVQSVPEKAAEQRSAPDFDRVDEWDFAP